VYIIYNSLPAVCDHGPRSRRTLCTGIAEASFSQPTSQLDHGIQQSRRGSGHPPLNSQLCKKSQANFKAAGKSFYHNPKFSVFS